MKTLDAKSADALIAFMECFDLYTTGVWARIEAGMREDFGIEDPETALEHARAQLTGE